MPNRLAAETSPYLLQHANNPVDWYPWGEEALSRAQAENKPIFLSIGYSACHWCHVMEHESFEDPRIAAVMNEHFINIKVDREERPDLDSIYMDAVVAMTGHGGWPMSVFLLPDGTPFYGGTYFPPTPRQGMPGFEQVLVSLAHAYHNQPQQVQDNGRALAAHLQSSFALHGEGVLDESVPERAAAALARNFDGVNGGFGGSPKFPQPMMYDFLLRICHRRPNKNLLQMVELTLLKMAHGGIYDQLGGGFHRYSVDAVWLVPHFEKMLYDNALLARLYLHAFQATGKPFYRKIVEETLDYVLREMTDESGGFYSTQDADSEGEEGKFFLWTPDEVQAVLGNADAEIFCTAFDVRPGGNFEGKSILNVPVPLDQVAERFNLSGDELAENLRHSRAKLFAAREQRVKPARDDKIITAWNGLMLAAFAEAARVLNRADYRQAAERNAEFVLNTMLHNGRLFRTWKAGAGSARLMGYLEDYAFYADGLLALYQTTFESRWFRQVQSLVETVLEHFADEAGGGFFDTANDHEQLVSRPKNVQDNAIPSGNSMAVKALLLLAAYTGQEKYDAAARSALAALQEPLVQYPAAFAQWLSNVEFAVAGPKEIAIIGSPDDDATRQLLAATQLPYRPNQVVAAAPEGNSTGHPELLAHRPMQNGQPTAYVCQNFTCRRPVTSVEELKPLLAL